MRVEGPAARGDRLHEARPPPTLMIMRLHRGLVAVPSSLLALSLVLSGCTSFADTAADGSRTYRLDTAAAVSPPPTWIELSTRG